MLRIRGIRKKRATTTAAAMASPRSKPPPSPPYQSTKPMHRMFLDNDILVVICSKLPTTSDRLAFISTSRRCHLVLKNAAYTHTVLRPDGPSHTLLPVLLEDTVRCTHILHLDVWLSRREQYEYVPGRDDIQQMWRQRGEFVLDVQRVLKHAKRLQRLCVREGDHEVGMSEVLSLVAENERLPFRLTSCRVARPTTGVLEFLETQTAITHLVLPRRTNFPYEIESWHEGFFHLGSALPNLQKLWATPWWMRALLMRAPIRTLGLMEDTRAFNTWVDDPNSTEAWMLSSLLEELGNMGGHSTVKCLAIPLRVLFGGAHSNVQALSKAFPKVQKISVTLDPWKLMSPGPTARDLQPLIASIGSDSIFQSAREFCILGPGTWPHDASSGGELYDVPQKFAIPNALLKLMPELVHVDTTHTCYSRLGAGVRHPGYGMLGGVDPISVLGQEMSKHDLSQYRFMDPDTRVEDVVWFGRPRSECQLSEDWC